MNTLIIYSTLGCHLCEQAIEVLKPVLKGGAYSLQEVDISESDKLMAMYAERIPVVYRPDLELELDWPFDSQIANAFLAATE